MIARFLTPGNMHIVHAAMRDRPAELHAALAAISQTMTRYAALSVEAGADGLFFATNVATRALIAPEQYREFGTPYDLPILEAVAEAPFTMLHICGRGVHDELFHQYPVQAFNWELDDSNPTLKTMERRTGACVAGGVSPKPVDLTLNLDQIAAQASAAVEAMGGRHLLVAPGCSSSPSLPDTSYLAARRGVRGE